MMFRSVFALSLFAALSVFPLLSSASYVLSTPGIGNQALTPSVDTLTLNTSTGTASLGVFNLQSGVFFVGDSGYLSGTFPYTFNENVTIDGDTEIVPVSVSLVVTNPTQANLDTLQILASSSSVFFSGPGVYFTINSYQSPGLGVNGSADFTLTANLTQAQSVPEPATLGLVTAALAGLAIARRRRKSH